MKIYRNFRIYLRAAHPQTPRSCRQLYMKYHKNVISKNIPHIGLCIKPIMTIIGIILNISGLFSHQEIIPLTIFHSIYFIPIYLIYDTVGIICIFGIFNHMIELDKSIIKSTYTIIPPRRGGI